MALRARLSVSSAERPTSALEPAGMRLDADMARYAGALCMTGDTGSDIVLGPSHQLGGLHSLVKTGETGLGLCSGRAIRGHAASTMAGDAEGLLAMAPLAPGIVDTIDKPNC